MAFIFNNLDSTIRDLMIGEVEFDIADNKLYISKNFSTAGISLYPKLLKDAIANGNEETLANDLKKHNCFNLSQVRNIKSGPIQAKVPSNANLTLAEGEFNRFYIRALCKFAIQEGKRLIIYRAKDVQNPRIESEMKIGQSIDPIQLLSDLRANKGVDTSLGIPNGPNSGLSACLE